MGQAEATIILQRNLFFLPLASSQTGELDGDVGEGTLVGEQSGLGPPLGHGQQGGILIQLKLKFKILFYIIPDAVTAIAQVEKICIGIARIIGDGAKEELPVDPVPTL